MRVIHDQHQRLGAREAGAQPHHRVGDRGGAVRSGYLAVEQQAAGGSRRAGQECRALTLGHLAQGWLEQRANDAEGEVTLVRARGGLADETAGVRREPSGMLEQRGLPEAGGGLEDDDAAGSAGEGGDSALERVELGHALDEDGLARRAHRAP